MIGYASGSWLVLDPQDGVLRNYTAAGVFAGGTASEDAAAYTQLVELADRGDIRSPSESLAYAQELLNQGLAQRARGARGRVEERTRRREIAVAGPGPARRRYHPRPAW